MFPLDSLGPHSTTFLAPHLPPFPFSSFLLIPSKALSSFHAIFYFGILLTCLFPSPIKLALGSLFSFLLPSAQLLPSLLPFLSSFSSLLIFPPLIVSSLLASLMHQQLTVLYTLPPSLLALCLFSFHYQCSTTTTPASTLHAWVLVGVASTFPLFPILSSTIVQFLAQSWLIHYLPPLKAVPACCLCCLFISPKRYHWDTWNPEKDVLSKTLCLEII